MGEARTGSIQDKLRRYQQLIPLPVLVAAGLFFFLRFYHTLLVYPDTVTYITQAKHILKGLFVLPFWAHDPGMSLRPGFPFAIILLKPLGGDWLVSAYRVGLLAGLGSIALVYMILHRITGKVFISVFGSLLVILHPQVVYYTTAALTESPYSFVALGCMALTVWKFLDSGRPVPMAAALGAMVGLAFMTRFVGIVLIVPVLFWTISGKWLDPESSRPGWKGLLRDAAVVLAVFLVIAAGHRITTQKQAAPFKENIQVESTAVYSLISKGGEAVEKETIFTRIFGAAGRAPIFIQTSQIFEKMGPLGKTYLREYLKIFYWPFLVIPLTWFVFDFVKRGRYWKWGLFILTWIPLAPLAALVNAGPEVERYLFPATVPTLLFVAIGSGGAIHSVSELIRNKAGLNEASQISISWVLVLILTGVFYSHYSESFTGMKRSRDPRAARYSWVSGHQEAAKFVRSRVELSEAPIVMDRKPYSAYFFNGLHITIPAPDMKQIVSKARATGTELFVADSSILQRFFPSLVQLSMGRGAPPEMKIVYSKMMPQYNKAITVYRFRFDDE